MAYILPKDVRTLLANTFISQPQEHARMIFFLAKSQASGVSECYIESLRNVAANKDAFKKFTERMIQDTRTDKNDPMFRDVMKDIWNNTSKSYSSKHADGAEQTHWGLQNTSFSATLRSNYMAYLADLPPESLEALHDVFRSFGNSDTEGVREKRLMQDILKPTGPLGRYLLIFVYFAINVHKNFEKWKLGEKFERKIVISNICNFVRLSVVIAGALGGADIGTRFGSPFEFVGLALGFVAGILSERGLARQLPEREALEKAYDLIGVSQDDSDRRIESIYRKLAFQHHPDKGGNSDKFIEVQIAKKMIQESRSESKGKHSVVR